MKWYLLRKKMFTVMFLAFIFGYSAWNFSENAETWAEAAKDEAEEGEYQELVSAVESSMQENMTGRMDWIELYSYTQVLLDKREFNNFSYIKDEEGFLHYASFFREDDKDIPEYALRMKRLKDYVEPYGTEVLFVVPPGKYMQDYTVLRTGLPVNDPNSIVDETMFYMNRMGLETLDLRDYYPNADVTYEEAFFKSDHHWTIPAAFYATGILVDIMEERFGEELDPNDYYMDIDNYEIVTYKSGMLGSMGRRTGANYCGLEDFTALWPTFNVNYTREYDRNGYESKTVSGTTEDVLMDKDVLTKESDIYSDSQYSLYLNGLCYYDKIVNEDNPDGPKILMIRDSYFSPVITFMAPMCSEIHAVWSLEDSEKWDIETYIKENEFDYIIMEVYPYNIEDAAFNFFKDTTE